MLISVNVSEALSNLKEWMSVDTNAVNARKLITLTKR
jgi:hypothetical protein